MKSQIFQEGEAVARRLQEMLQVAYVYSVGLSGFILTAKDRDALSAYIFECSHSCAWDEIFRSDNWNGVPVEVFHEGVTEDGD